MILVILLRFSRVPDGFLSSGPLLPPIAVAYLCSFATTKRYPCDDCIIIPFFSSYASTWFHCHGFGLGVEFESDAFSGPGDALRPWLSAKKVYIRSTTIFCDRFCTIGVLMLFRSIWRSGVDGGPVDMAFPGLILF